MAAFRTGEFFEGVIELLFKFWNGIGEVRWAEVFSVDQKLLFREGDREALLGGVFRGMVQKERLRFGIETIEIGCNILQTDGVLTIHSEPRSVVFFVVRDHHLAIFIHVIELSTKETEVHELLISEENAT